MTLDRRSSVIYAILAAFAAALLLSLYTGNLILLAAGMCFIIAIVAGFLYPYAFILMYAILIPFEDVVQINGIGSLSRGVGIFFALCYIITRFREIRFNAVPLQVWLWFGWGALSMLWAYDPTVGWKNVFLLTQEMLMLLLIVNAIGKYPKLAVAVLWGYTLAAAVTAGIATQHYTAHPNSLNGPARVQAFEKQDEAHFAGVCVAAFLFSLHQLLDNFRNRLRTAFTIPLLLILGIAILMSGTRSAWVALVFSIAVLLFPKMNAKTLVLSLVGFVLLGYLATKVPNLVDFINTRTSEAVSSGGAGRTDIWKVGLVIFKEHPFIGVGLGNFPKVFDWDVIARTVMAGADITHMEEGRAAHNIYLATMGELGVIGLILLFLFLGKVLRFESGNIGLLVKVMVLSYLIQGFFLDLMNRKYFWLIIALALGISYGKKVASVQAKEIKET